MSKKTNVRADVSKKNTWYISKYRHYELRHFCLQYPEWEREYASFDSLSKTPAELVKVGKTNHIADPVAYCVEKKDYYWRRLKMVDNAAQKVAESENIVLDKTVWKLWNVIVFAVTREAPYEYVKEHYHIPVGRDKWYDMYRHFFWELDKLRK